jgi:hypothetical protein
LPPAAAPAAAIAAAPAPAAVAAARQQQEKQQQQQHYSIYFKSRAHRTVVGCLASVCVIVHFNTCCVVTVAPFWYTPSTTLDKFGGHCAGVGGRVMGSRMPL